VTPFSIGTDAFAGCSSLTVIKPPWGPAAIGENFAEQVTGVYVHTFDDDMGCVIMSETGCLLAKGVAGANTCSTDGDVEPAWCPKQRGGYYAGQPMKPAISFSFLRSDLNPGGGEVIYPLIYENSWRGGTGLIASLDSAAGQVAESLCLNPMDSGSQARTVSGCGPQAFPLGPCPQEKRDLSYCGNMTVDEFIQQWPVPDANNSQICSLSPFDTTLGRDHRTNRI
jgi:hypothetical protein